MNYWGESKMASMIGGIISIAIGAVVMANVFIFTIKNTSTTGWSGTETTMWGLLTLMGILGILIGTLQVFGLF